MTDRIRIFLLLSAALTAVAIVGCSRPGSSTNAGNPGNANSKESGLEKRTKATGTIVADPNPIKVCDGTRTGVTTLRWSAAGTTMVEVRTGSPEGGLFARTGPAGGTKETGRWVGNGTLVYLQDVSDGKPLTAEYTIAQIAVYVTTDGCP